MDTAPHKRWEDYPGWYLSTFPLRKMGSPTIAPIHQLSPFWKFCLLEGKWTSLQVQQSSEAGRLWRELNCHKTGNSDFCSYMLSLCTGAACRGAFHELWQIPILKDAYKQSKYINLPIKHTGSSGPAACLNTSVCQSSSMISACCLQKKPAFWIVFSAESQSWRRQG